MIINANLNILGHSVNIHSRSDKTKEEAKMLLEVLRCYKQHRQTLDLKIIENESVFKGELFKNESGRTGGNISYMFNACWNKHADAMDNYPEAQFLEREPSDAKKAEMLSKIVPMVLEKTDFESVYSDVWWYKIKQGTGVYGVFWDQTLENGLGDIKITKIDLLRIYAEPGIENIQDSPYVFILSLVDLAALTKKYPRASIENACGMKAQGYFSNISDDILKTKACVIDCYEKEKNNMGMDIVHLTKIVGQAVIYSTKTDEKLAETGLYDHGLYPFVTDSMIPVENSLFGLSVIDITKNTQQYIDRLDTLIERNAMLSARQRFIIKRNSGIDRNQLSDLSCDFIDSDTSVTEDAIRPFQASPIPEHIMAHRINKISELKEVIGNRDFSQGGISGGVTAYGAIAALQEAGNKLSRDIIKSSYISFSKVVSMCIELIRQFYSTERNFRILNQNGEIEYISFSNSVLLPEKKSLAGYEDNGQKEVYRKAIFDIQIVPQRKNPFNTISHNQMIMQLLSQGAFDPKHADQTLIAVDSMILDNKDAITKRVRESKTIHDIQSQKLSELDKQNRAMSMEMEQMAEIIRKTTGEKIAGK